MMLFDKIGILIARAERHGRMNGFPKLDLLYRHDIFILERALIVL